MESHRKALGGFAQGQQYLLAITCLGLLVGKGDAQRSRRQSQMIEDGQRQG